MFSFVLEIIIPIAVCFQLSIVCSIHSAAHTLSISFPFSFCCLCTHISLRVSACLSVCLFLCTFQFNTQCIVVKFMFKLEINQSQLFIAIVFGIDSILPCSHHCEVYFCSHCFGDAFLRFFICDFPLVQLLSHIVYTLYIDSIECWCCCCICAHTFTLSITFLIIYLDSIKYKIQCNLLWLCNNSMVALDACHECRTTSNKWKTSCDDSCHYSN